MNHHYIPLNRTFFDFSENQNIEDAAMRSYLDKYLNNLLDWDQLLKSRCIVILGEPGSGKTWEMENQVKVRSNAGNYAFFLRLEQLLDRTVPFNTLFSPSDREKCLSWQKEAQQEAIFFLDAKDEAALKTAYALRDALTNFVNHLGHSNLRQCRAKVVISCRVSEWHPHSDQDDIRRCFDLAEEKKESQRTSQSKQMPNLRTFQLPSLDQVKQVPDLRIVQLAPLDPAQVKILATAWGITQPDEFLQAVDTRYAWGLMGRPLDVESVVKYWQRHGTLGTLRKLIEDDITHKLEQHGDTHKEKDPLSALEARQAVEALAAATLFCKQFTFVLPKSDGYAQGISPKAIFSDWDDKKIGYVLNRPLFDEAIYGHVRFHHRQTAEYLAASWLQKRLEYGCPLTEIKPLLFVDRYGQTVIPPSRAPALAWLAVMGNEIWNWRIRQSLLQNHPEILLRYGDPQSLTIEDKRVLLTRLMEKYIHQQRVFLETDAEKLALFGSPELAEDLKQHLRNKSLSNDLRELLLKIIYESKLSDCMEVALEILQTLEEDDDLKIYAALAVRDTGLPEHRQQLAVIINTYQSLSSRLCGVVCQALYPHAIDANDLVRLLEKTKSVTNSSWGLPDVIGELMKSTVPEAHFDILLIHFNRLILSDKQPERYDWLRKGLGELVKRILQQPVLDEKLIQELVKALLSLNRGDRETISFPKELKKHFILRRACIWKVIQYLKGTEPNKIPSLPEISESFRYNFLINARQKNAWQEDVWQEADIEWLLDNVATFSCEADRVIVLHLAIDLWNDTGCARQYAKHFHTVTKDNAALQEIVQKKSGNRLFCNVKRRWNAYRYKYGLYDLKWKLPHHLESKWQKLRERWSHLYNWFWLIRHQQGLRSGKEWHALIVLMDEARPSNSMKRGTADWQSLEAIYGRTIAHAAREGWKAFWKTFEPQLPHEKKEANRIDRVRLGLTGLNTAVKDGLKMETLSPQEARFATAYAMNELNGFPEWFAELAGTTHKRVVQEVLLPCIQAEWKISAEQPHISVLLSNLTYAAPSLPMVANKVLNLLLQEDPAHHDVLTQALEFAFNSFRKEHLNALIPVADQRLQNLTSDNPSFMTWLITWLQIEGMRATTFLKNFLETAPTHSDVVMKRLCATLSGHRPNYLRCKNPAYLQPKVLEQFIPLVYQYVRPIDDIKHEGVYSPTSRDDAQGFRNTLLQRLAESTEPEAYEALQRLMEKPLLANERKWISKLLVDQRERSAEDVPWEPQDIAKFAQCYETTPRSAHSLFNLILKRFIQIQDEVQCDDFSMRNVVFRSSDLEKELRIFLEQRLKELSKEHYTEVQEKELQIFLRKCLVVQEKELRIFLGQRLKELSHKHYTVVQEAEVDAGKKPDLRVVVAGLGPIMIEIKLGHKWSYTELKEALTEQLVGLYLRSQNSRHGILVIGKNEEKNEWRDQEKNPFNFK